MMENLSLLVAYGYERRTTRLMNISTKDSQYYNCHQPKTHEKIVASVFSLTEDRLVCAYTHVNINQENIDQEVQIINMDTGRIIYTYKSYKYVNQNPIYQRRVDVVTLSSDGSLIALGLSNGTIIIQNMDTGVEYIITEAHSLCITALAISPDNHTLVSGSIDHRIKIWTIGSSAEPPVILLGHTDTIRSLAISHDGNTLVSGAFNGYINIWDAHTGLLKHSIYDQQMHNDNLLSVVITPDDQTVIGGSFRGVIALWDIKTGKLRSSYASTTNTSIRSIAIVHTYVLFEQFQTIYMHVCKNRLQKQIMHQIKKYAGK